MNNSFPRLIDGMCATLRTEVLSRLDDEFARGQVFGVINLLNTFKVRADWASGFLLEQIAAQQQALGELSRLLDATPGAPPLPQLDAPVATPIAELLMQRDAGNRAFDELQVWLDGPGRAVSPALAGQLDAVLRRAMRTEVDLELKYAPRPLFAEMSSGREA